MARPERRWGRELAQVGLAFGAVMAVLFVWLGQVSSGPKPSAEENGPWDPFFVMTIRMADAEDVESRPGEVEDLSRPEATALCWVHHRYRQNMALDADVTVVTDVGLVRSAELLAGDYRGDRAALRAENLGSLQGDWRVPTVMSQFEHEGEWTDAEVERATAYLIERLAPPSAEAVEGFVVFEVSATMSSRMLVRMRLREIANADEPTSRNTALWGTVRSPDRKMALRLSRGQMNDVCDAVR